MVGIKICGLTTPEAVAAAVAAGADALGFVFAESPRRVSVAQAVALARRIPPTVARVAVFRHPEERLLHQVMAELKPHRIQAEATCRLAAPLLPVFRMGADGIPGFEAFVRHHQPRRPLALVEGPASGSGVAVDWERLRGPARQVRLILAGGLDPANVAAAIRTVRPCAVDVSSGVESRPGVKDPHRIEAFVAAVQAVSRELEESHVRCAG